MNELLHMPGPWEIKSADKNDKGMYQAIVKTVAGPYKITALAFGRSKEEAEANGKLIAAAPDMLDVLLLAYARLSANTSQNKNILNSISRIIDKATK